MFEPIIGNTRVTVTCKISCGEMVYPVNKLMQMLRIASMQMLRIASKISVFTVVSWTMKDLNVNCLCGKAKLTILLFSYSSACALLDSHRKVKTS